MNSIPFHRCVFSILVIDASESLEKCQQLYEFVAKRVSEIVPSERRKRKQRKNCE